jgi:NhaP-type Na+/H+ or K+/H+ antiporter
LRIRQALDVEAGMNDGMAVPFLLFFLALARTGTDGAGAILLRHVAEQLGIGAILGGVIGLAGGWLLGQARRRQWMADSLQQLGLVSLPLLSVMACEIFGGSMFIAAYVAGLAVQSGFAEAGHHSAEFTEGWGQLFSYFIFFYFGLRVTLTLGSLTLWHLLYAVLSLTVIRMLPVAIALAGTRLSTASVLFMGWFGPRGLASIVLGLVFLAEEAQLPGEQTIALTVIATVLLSIFAHGLSALPGIGRYARKVDTLAKTAPEFGKIETIPREPRPSAQDRKAW